MYNEALERMNLRHGRQDEEIMLAAVQVEARW